LWVVAARQTRGHGRLGREWISPPGNLHASLVLGDFGEACRRARSSASWRGRGNARLARRDGGSRGFALKWPNDLLLEGAKLGGILLRCRRAADRRCARAARLRRIIASASTAGAARSAL
jgi:BirA family biotin operon repressor/biotin-[acetyl-CoA-carboxylase] ligase